MSIANQTDRAYGNGNGVTSTFSFPFKIFDSSQLLVYLINSSTGVVTGPLTLNVDYTVFFSSVVEGGTVTFMVAPAIGYEWFIKRTVQYTQSATIPSEGVFPGQQFENQLDLMTMMIIQVNESVSSNLQMPATYTGSLPVLFPLPAANQVIGWDPTGMFLKNLVVGGQGPVGPAGPQGPKGDPGTGTVSAVSSANTDISVANGTTTPTLTLNSGTGANQIIKLDGSGKLPAIDGSQLINLPAVSSYWVPNNIQVFTSTGTWTKPAGVSKVYVRVIGGGGAGGQGNASSTAGHGGGGGGGGYSEGFTTVTTNVTVTIGSTNSFAGAVTIQATKGSTGSNGGATVGGIGGVGGVGSGGSINAQGGPGGNGGVGAGGNSGQGGSSALGGGAIGVAHAASGGTGGVYGGGGSGGGCDSNGNGGTADVGAVIVAY